MNPMLIQALYIALHVTTSSMTCFDPPPLIQDGRYLQHHAFRIDTARTMYDCVALCVCSSVCLSVSFSHAQRECHLHNTDTEQDSLVQRDGFLHSGMSAWPQAISGPCSGILCPGGRCYVNRLHQPRCEPESMGCGESPSVTGAEKRFTGQHEGAVTMYRCNEDYIQCRNSSLSVCQSTGDWDDLTGLCGLAKWNNPASAMMFPCGPSEKFSISIEATPTAQATNCIFDVKREQEILMHSDWRMDIGQVNFGSLISNTWSTGSTYPSLPLTVGVTSTLQISFEDGNFKIVADGNHIQTVAENPLGGIPEYIVHFGGCTVETVLYTIA